MINECGSVKEFVKLNGDWDLDRVENMLTSEDLQRLVEYIPLSISMEPARQQWPHSYSDELMVASAYKILRNYPLVNEDTTS